MQNGFCGLRGTFAKFSFSIGPYRTIIPALQLSYRLDPPIRSFYPGSNDLIEKFQAGQIVVPPDEEAFALTDSVRRPMNISRGGQ
jgi:hypothetical protein